MPRMGSPPPPATEASTLSFSGNVTDITSLLRPAVVGLSIIGLNTCSAYDLPMTRAYVDDISAERLELAAGAESRALSPHCRAPQRGGASHAVSVEHLARSAHAAHRDHHTRRDSPRRHPRRADIAAERECERHHRRRPPAPRHDRRDSHLCARRRATSSRLRAAEFSIESVRRAGVRAQRIAHREEEARPRRDDRARPSACSTPTARRSSHVLGNLLGNAIDFTLAGRPRVDSLLARGHPRIAATSCSSRSATRGIGIAPEHHELVFREFAQVDASASRQHHGTGLGLAIARKFVELHDGRLWVESTLGTGSRFFFTLPVRSAP